MGKRNYRYFYFFLVSLGIHCVFIFSCAISHLVLLAKDDRGGGSNSFASGSRKETSDFIEAVKDSPASIIVCIICFFSMWSILGLAGNATTIWEHRLTNLL